MQLRQKQSPCAAILKEDGLVNALYFGQYTASFLCAFYVFPGRVVNPVTIETQHLADGGPYLTHMRRPLGLTQAT